jgi:hypothetical protein
MNEMKIKIYTLLIFLLTSFQISFGQCIWNGNEGVNTTLGTTIGTYNWKLDRYLVYTRQSQIIPDTIFSPFSNNSNPEPNIIHFTGQSVKDYEPSEGWELAQVNFGAPSNPYPNPTLMLYNRYLGILRIFIHVPYSENFNRNTATIDVLFFYPDGINNRYETALLAPVGRVLKGLDFFEKNLVTTSLQRSKEKGLFWLYADLPVAYDPCTCKNFTGIRVRPNFINVQKVDLKTSILTTNLMTGGNASNNFGSNISHALNAFNNTITDATKRGTQVATSVETASKFLDTYILNQFKRRDSSYLIPLNNGIDGFFQIDFLSQLKVPKDVKDGLGIFGAVFGLVEYFVTGGKTTATSASNINYRVTGTITDSIPGQESILYLPGSNWQGQSSGNAVKFKPVYNNAMGIFSLVETPKINFALGNLNIPGANYPVQTVTFKLNSVNQNEVIKYIINPASGLKAIPDDIKASLVVKIKKKDANSSGGPVAKPEVKSRDNYVFEEKGTQNATIQTPLMSLQCLNDYIGIFSCNDCTVQDLEFRVNIIATLGRKDNSGKPTVFNGQYLLAPTGISSLPLPSISDVNNVTNIKLEENISELNLTSDRTIQAWDKIVINGNINTNGFKLRLVAGKSIDIKDPSQLNSNIDLQIGIPNGCDQIIAPVSNTFAQNFCNSSQYRPQIQSLKVPTIPAVSNVNSHSFLISPNPFTDQITIDLNIEEATNANLDLSNAVGQTLKSMRLGVKEKGSYQETIETNDLAPGIYFLTLRTQNGTETKKIVKQ